MVSCQREKETAAGVGSGQNQRLAAAGRGQTEAKKSKKMQLVPQNKQAQITISTEKIMLSLVAVERINVLHFYFTDILFVLYY